MATVSAPNLAFPATPAQRSPSPPLSTFKKVFSHRRRSSEADNDNDVPGRRSVDSLNSERKKSISSSKSSPTRDGGSISSQSGIQKLIPGHSKRQRQRLRESELKTIEQEPIPRGRPQEIATSPPPGAMDNNRSTSSLLTDGSENDTPPPLVSRNSHTGYFTTSSPLIASKTLNDAQHRTSSNTSLPMSASTEAFPVILEPESANNGGSVSPRTQKLDLGSTPVLSSSKLYDKADTLRVDEEPQRRGSISKLRGKSPVRKFKDVFSRSSKSPRTSPERETPAPPAFSDSTTTEHVSIAERRLADNPTKPLPAPLRDHSATIVPAPSAKTPLVLETDVDAPKTPPSARLSTPLTTVTPPTPTDLSRDEVVASPKMVDEIDRRDTLNNDKPPVSFDSNLGHRRVRSASSTHQKSKLSTSMTIPLTPTIEEPGNPTGDKVAAAGRNTTPSSGFFSSWVSAAQNAASTITNLTAQNRSRAGTSTTDPGKVKSGEETEQTESEQDADEMARRQLAVETLGSGNLDLSQLGIETSGEDRNASSGRLDLSGLRKKSDLQKDEAQARVEDILAKRAVSAAYEGAGESTPIAEVSDPMGSIRHAQPFDITPSGTLTPPNGVTYESEDHRMHRSNSVRSKLAKRRSRGSSVATGQSTVSSTTAPSTVVMASPTTAVRSTRFTPAPKQRNNAYHQQFRSVPEDDSLIEDYSCALQKEILLAGRIYISEGHICFSSNILGWVTTLIISFEEIVSIERESTAMIIPNAIAIQTLHARHTFRSLLSREATFDLMIGIWKVNHPASFSKSVNGKQFVAEQAQHDAEKALSSKPADDGESEPSSDEGSGSDEDDDEDDDDEGSAPSIIGSTGSIAGSEYVEAKAITRKPSGAVMNSASTNGTAPAATGDVVAAASVVTSVPATATDFPGPATHAPTECTDSATHYDKVIKDEVIAAPLGKIYSLLYGQQSGAFLRKYLVDEQKCFDLVLEDDKKGLTNDSKSRQYSYIKPLGGAIGPKQTKCITVENLDFFDLEKSISVTCSTTTPDVPSGNAFATKTRYCLSWAPGNGTRLQMNCTIEWSAKSWLKGPIEKGANDGQQQYGDGLVKALKAALGRSRGATNGSKGGKPKKKKKGEKKSKPEQSEQNAQKSRDWGLFEPLRPILEPLVDIAQPIMRMEVFVGILAIMVFVLWFGGAGRSGRQIGYGGSVLDRPERLVAYEHLWQKEESELWDWLEDRAGINRVVLGGSSGRTTAGSTKPDPKKSRQRALKDKSMAARLQAEKWSRKEIQEAVRVTRERLDEMQRVLDEKVV